MRRKKKSDPKKVAAIVIIVVLALVVGTGVVIQEIEKGRGHHRAVPVKPTIPRPATRIVKEYALPEVLIKGCLFELGISRHDIRFMGYAIKVTVHELPTEDNILRAFEPLKDGGEVSLSDPAHLRVKLNGVWWDILFFVAEENLAKCAIIVDDMGQSLKTAEQLGRIDANLTFAVLPGLPDSRKVAEHLHSAGRELLLHLPMQGNGKNPGPGAILEGMSLDEVHSILKDDLREVPYITGVNNHMGSVITTDADDMRLVFKELKQDGLFFVDSRTTSKSVCASIARDFHVPFIERDVFLDNEQNAAYITGQVRKLVSISLKHSSAVGICHPHPDTIAVLEKEVPRLKQLGVEVVRVSALMEQPQGAR